MKINYIPALGGYGLLYNWYVTQGAIAPAGWHVPTVTEYNTLITYLGGSTVAGGKMKEVGFLHWSSPNVGATNESGFSAVGAGLRFWTGTPFEQKKFFAQWWTTTEKSFFGLSYDDDDIFYQTGSLNTYGFSLRLLKDDSTDPGTLTDYDGNVYPTVKIGDQVWMAKNLKVTHYTDGTDIPNVTDNAAWVALITWAYCIYPRI